MLPVQMPFLILVPHFQQLRFFIHKLPYTMRKQTITAQAALIVQIAAGTEVEAIVHGGLLYVPVMSYPDVEGTSDTAAPSAPKGSTSKPAAPAKPASKPVAAKAPAAADDLPSLKEMQAMTLPDLLALAKREDIDVEALKAEHKVTRWSVVTLSKALDEAFADSDGADVGKKAMTVTKGGKANSADPDKEEFDAIFNDLDGNAITEDEAVARLTTLCDNEDVASQIVGTFMDNDKLTIDELYDEYQEALEGGSKKKSTPAKSSSKPAGKSAAPAKSPVGKGKSKAVEPEDLEEGDKIRGFWDNEDAWFEGEVVGIDSESALPIIAWEDETEGVLDTDEVSKLERL